MKISLFKFFVFIFSCFSIVYCWNIDKKFVILDDESGNVDGYASQILGIIHYIDDGGGFANADPLHFIHALRALVGFAFLFLENLGGSILSVLVILSFVFPLFYLFKDSPRKAIALILPLTVIFLSYRSVLVYVGVGYLILYLKLLKSPILLFLSFCFVNLSSGSVLASMLITLILGNSSEFKSIQLKFYLFVLGLSLGFSFIDKFYGFVAQDPGYESTIEGATGLLALISRSTMIGSMIAGDYFRSSSYFLIFIMFCFAMLYSALNWKYSRYSLIFLTTIPLFLMEGLAVTSLLVPFLMFLSGLPMPRNHN